MNTLIVFSFLSTLLGLLGGSSSSQPVLFKSAESKTQDGNAVFNKISFNQKNGLDIWEMQQSHYGSTAGSDKWDNIRIVVNTTTKPYTASFHQLRNGQEVEYSANCMRCHSGGPRLIRPVPEQQFNLREKIKIAYWNNKIKSYGEVNFKVNSKIKVRKLKLKNPMSYRKITTKTCIQCHNKGGPRAELTSFQKGSILYLVKSKQMPPWPYKLSKTDKAHLLKEIYSL
jgi:mono/diheme cytochrome c family protein